MQKPESQQNQESQKDEGMTFPEFKRRMKTRSKNQLIQILFNAFVHNFQLQKRVNELTELDVPQEEEKTQDQGEIQNEKN